MTAPPNDRFIKFANCRLAIANQLVPCDIYFSSITGRIVDHQRFFFEQRPQTAIVHDLGGRIVAPGFIECQINGGYGFDFSLPTDKPNDYRDGVAKLNKELIKTGVTSYLPTVTSQGADVYPKTLPHLAAPGTRNPADGSESLGAHCEGPFINSEKNGIHKKEVLQLISSGVLDLESCYRAENLQPPVVKMVTLAPELDKTASVIQELVSRGIVVSIGHSNASYEQMCLAVRHGATMVTHLFNATTTPHHRSPGIFGVLGAQDDLVRPCYGIIADDIHVHPSFIKVAYQAHPEGAILVSDAMCMLGLPDGKYYWTNGDYIVKKGGKLTLQDTPTIAGSSVTLLECLNNFIKWTDASIASALRTVTETPAKMLGLYGVKGSLRPGADADFVVLSERKDVEGNVSLVVDEVWKFGVKVVGSGSIAKL
ncbi:hypothetical protein FN846DRAFT_963785 [Sphaerosporella brunnea]|uniref:N-acetylglucosamine-6-phosphate deacetylase n=1 Tax=Sphaerosporella brunnea TaxID=1250544 RepID=A0A5J5EMD8_9PEZI|nr:hypothetical protein FN846DRAFT_963785 [Sphaerosporella brunnea]